MKNVQMGKLYKNYVILILCTIKNITSVFVSIYLRQQYPGNHISMEEIQVIKINRSSIHLSIIPLDRPDLLIWEVMVKKLLHTVK